MADFTLNELLNFTKKEEEMVKEIMPALGLVKPEPSERSVKNLIAYSQALSIRKSRSLNSISLMLN